MNQGSQRDEILRLRPEIAERLIEKLGMSMAEVAWLLGGSAASISGLCIE